MNSTTRSFISQRLLGLKNWYAAVNNTPNTIPANNQYFLNWAFQHLVQNPDITWSEFYGEYLATPCEKLGDIFSPTKANVKSLITGGMYSYINNSSVGEAGVYLKKDASGTYTNEVAPYTGTASLPPKFGGDYYSTIHTHPKSTYPIFSYSDLTVMYKLETQAATHNKKQSSFLLVCEDDNGVKQTYGVVFESSGLFMEEVWNMPELAGCSIQDKIKALDKELKLAYDTEYQKTDSDPTYKPNYERVFLKFTYGTNIGLYKADSTLTSWSKLTIATNSDTATVTPTNCN